MFERAYIALRLTSEYASYFWVPTAFLTVLIGLLAWWDSWVWSWALDLVPLASLPAPMQFLHWLLH